MGWNQSYTPLTRPRLNTSSVWRKAQTPSNYYYYYYYYCYCYCYYLSAYQALEPKTAVLQMLVQVQVLVFCCVLVLVLVLLLCWLLDWFGC